MKFESPEYWKAKLAVHNEMREMLVASLIRIETAKQSTECPNTPAPYVLRRRGWLTSFARSYIGWRKYLGIRASLAAAWRTSR